MLGQTATTLATGQALLPWPAKLKTQEDRCKVRVSRAGYVTSDLDLQVISGSLYSNRFSISPTLEPKRVRVVLDWGASPADLDAHLVERKRFHISSRYMKYWRDVVRLDRADTDGYGPETITLDRVKNARNYAFMVHDYSHHHNSDAANFEAAGATVQLYMDGRLKAQFRPPPGRGNLWNVFSIRKGQLIIENQVSKLR